jgi:hypothetical protein
MPVPRASSLTTPEKRLDYHFPLTARVDIINKFLVIILFLWDNLDGSNRYIIFRYLLDPLDKLAAAVSSG